MNLHAKFIKGSWLMGDQDTCVAWNRYGPMCDIGILVVLFSPMAPFTTKVLNFVARA